MGQLEGKVAVITGAASGMGAAAATLFSREGAHVVLADLNSPGGEAAAQSASEAGQRCVFQLTDVSSEADIQALVGRALSEFGRLDVMFNNAGIAGAIGPLEGVSGGGLGPHPGGLPARRLPRASSTRSAPMRAGGGLALIVSTPPRSPASTAIRTCTPYCAAKAGVVNLTRSASIEFAADKIRINCIAPGGVSTPILGGGTRFDKAAGRRDGWRRLSPCRWPASRMTSPRRRCSSSATPRASSPAIAWWSTAAPPPALSPAHRGQGRNGGSRNVRSRGRRSNSRGVRGGIVPSRKSPNIAPTTINGGHDGRGAEL